MNQSNLDKVIQMLTKIPKGRVVTYKSLATYLKIKNPRLIGTYIHKNTDPTTYPCHRVVKSNGTLASGYTFGGKNSQKQKLIEEGIVFSKDKIDLKKYQFHFPLEK